MGLEVLLERLSSMGMEVEVVGGDRSSRLVIDGVEVGSVCDDTVTLY